MAFRTHLVALGVGRAQLGFIVGVPNSYHTLLVLGVGRAQFGIVEGVSIALAYLILLCS